jgi:hypothetical protein
VRNRIRTEGVVQQPRARRPVRTAIAVVLIGLAAAAFAAPAAQAAPARVWLQLTDPQSTNPVRLQVAAVDGDGNASPFTGTVTIAVGRTRSTVPVTSTTGQEEVDVPTTALGAGPATASAVLKVGGKTLRTSIAGFVDLPASAVLHGFGCGVVTPKQKRVAWQVAQLNGMPVTYPAWTPSADTFPTYIHTVQPGRITDSLGQPVVTKGSVVIMSGTTKVATVKLPSATRRLLFSVAWSGTVKGRFTPGAYTAAITLTDALGRISTATQPLIVAKSSAGLCR